tara:strand:- start:1806 stop:3332 length:1527 start_codon:yes stop_codon:yes gene_type:complete
MRDKDVAALLDSDASLVVVEAPAGCGKTYQGANFAKRAASGLSDGRVLILTHTHAACGVFAKETREQHRKVEIRTIDSLIVQIASAYHKSLGLPPDPYRWAREHGAGSFEQLGALVARLLSHHPMVSQALAARYPVVIGDEHQDSSTDQHAAIMALNAAGAHVRIFGDPMQRIYGGKTQAAVSADRTRWDDLKAAGAFGELEKPHRWCDGSRELGSWILEARQVLKDGGQIDLTGTLPDGLHIHFAENQAQQRTGFQLNTAHRAPLDAAINSRAQILVLTGENALATSLRAFWNRQIPIWEGHTRDALGDLVTAISSNTDNPAPIAEAVVGFLGNVAVGFSPSSHGNQLVQEVRDGCTKQRREKPAHIQDLGRFILDQPNHVGVAKCLHHLAELRDVQTPGFDKIKIDYRQEYRDAVRLSEFASPEDGLGEINRRRSFARPMPPAKAISTVHKAKGLECDHAMIVPCDASRFSGTYYSRCRLYVALSRAKRSLTLVLSRNRPTPLFRI